MLVITKKFLLENRTSSGAWTRSQFNVLGMPWPPSKGWMSLAKGKEITDAQAADFIQASNSKAVSKLPAIKKMINSLSSDELGLLTRWLGDKNRS